MVEHNGERDVNSLDDFIVTLLFPMFIIIIEEMLNSRLYIYLLWIGWRKIHGFTKYNVTLIV